MTYMVHFLNSKLNIYIISRMLHKGWNLNESDKIIWLEKNGNIIIFDIVLPTPKWALYCMSFHRNTDISGVSRDA